MSTHTWNFDGAHSSILFIARHMVVARVYGRFNQFTGSMQIDPDNVTTGSVRVEVQTASIDTNSPDRDKHLRSADFLDVENHPVMSFVSSKFEAAPVGLRIHGDLSLRGITKPVVLEARQLGNMTDPWGQQRILFNGKTVLSRSDFGVKWNQAIDNGGWLVGEKIDIEVDVQAVKQQ